MPLEPVPHVGPDPHQTEATDSIGSKPSPAEKDADSAAATDQEAEDKDAASLPEQEKAPAGTD